MTPVIDISTDRRVLVLTGNTRRQGEWGVSRRAVARVVLGAA